MSTFKKLVGGTLGVNRRGHAVGASQTRGTAGPAGADGTDGADGADGATGPAGPAPSGTGFVRVTGGVLDTPGELSGDITSSGLVTTIGANKVTTAKILDANVTLAKLADLATKRAIGRNTGSTGVPETVTIEQMLNWIASSAQGDILYRNATDWVRLGAGTSGYFLQTLGTGQNPLWSPASTPGSGGIILGTGHPQGVVSGAIGSVYEDTANGYWYKKMGGGSTAYGWYFLAPNLGVGFGGPHPWACMPGTAGGDTSVNTQVANYGYWSADGFAPLTATNITTGARTTINSKIYASMTSATTNNQSMYLTTNILTKAGGDVLADDYDMWIDMRTGSDVTGLRIWFGITRVVLADSDTLANANGDGAILMRYSTPAGDGGWVGYTAAGNVGTTSGTTATVASIAANTNYRLRIRFVRQGTPTAYFSVNDSTEQSLTTNIPPVSRNYFPIFGLTVKNSAARTLHWRGWGAAAGS